VTAAFDAALVAALPQLWRQAYYLARSRTEADDLVGDVVVRALTKQHLFLPGTNLHSWLYVLLRNRVCDLVRRRAGVSFVSIDDAPESPDERLADPTLPLVLDELRAAVVRLSPARRAVLLARASGRSNRALERETGLPYGTIASRLWRDRDRLRTALEGTYAGERRG
jgi:RNA polymerase sigma-70 factor (ECF subfamily)